VENIFLKNLANGKTMMETKLDKEKTNVLGKKEGQRI